MRGKRGIRRIRSGLSAMTGLILLAGGIYAAGWSGIFSIKTILCTVDGKTECSAEITADLNQYAGKNLLFVRKVEIEKRIISADRLAETVKVNPRLPDSLGVEIFSRQPAAAITTADNIAEAVEVDKDGVILGKTENIGDLPRLVWPEIVNWPIENPVPENIVRAAVIAGLAGEKFQLEGIASIDSGSPYRSTGQASAAVTMVMKLKSGEKIWLSLDKQPVQQLTRLQVVLNQVRIEGKQVGEIDMRFERPVVRYE